MKSYQRSCLLLGIEAIQVLDAKRYERGDAALWVKWQIELRMLLDSLDGLGGVW